MLSSFSPPKEKDRKVEHDNWTAKLFKKLNDIATKGSGYHFFPLFCDYVLSNYMLRASHDFMISYCWHVLCLERNSKYSSWMVYICWLSVNHDWGIRLCLFANMLLKCLTNSLTINNMSRKSCESLDMIELMTVSNEIIQNLYF